MIPTFEEFLNENVSKSQLQQLIRRSQKIADIILSDEEIFNPDNENNILSDNKKLSAELNKRGFHTYVAKNLKDVKIPSIWMDNESAEDAHWFHCFENIDLDQDIFEEYDLGEGVIIIL